MDSDGKFCGELLFETVTNGWFLIIHEWMILKITTDN